MAKTARAKVSTDELVRAALLKVAEAGEAKLTGKTDGLFASASGANKEAVDACKSAEKPLLTVVGKEGKVELVTLAPAGFERIAADLPEDKVGAVAKRVAAAVPAAGRIDFIQDTIRRTPLATAELTPLLEEAIATEKAESEARVAAAAKRRATEEATEKALDRAKELIRQRRQNRIDAIKREWEAEGESAPELPAHKPAPEPAMAPQPEPKAAGSTQLPKTSEERDFRRNVADQLAASWRAAWDAKKDEPRDFLESAMWNVSGLKLVGEPGASLAFDGRYHESKSPVSSGESVRVARPGWALEEDERDYVVLKAVVEPR
ncbi:MAG: hypothetical protein J0I06_26835 [Planctomycetes bacterium]|nr:hypothetical protein [Planctomycetota bacterium]